MVAVGRFSTETGRTELVTPIMPDSEEPHARLLASQLDRNCHRSDEVYLVIHPKGSFGE